MSPSQKLKRNTRHFISTNKRRLEVIPEDLLTKTWQWKLLVTGFTFEDTGIGTCEGRMLIYADPPIGSAPVNQGEIARVLVVCSVSEENEFMAKLEEIHAMDVFKKPHHFKNVEVSVTNDTLNFWQNFFQQEKFLDCHQGNKIPDLILATGNIRDFDGIGADTIGIKPRLQEIARMWDIPIKFVELVHPN